MTQELRLLTNRQVCERCAISRGTVYKRIAEGTFPRPVHLSKRGRAWRSDDIAAWIAAQSKAPVAA